MRRKSTPAAVALIALLLAGCSIRFGVEHTPTPERLRPAESDTEEPESDASITGEAVAAAFGTTRTPTGETPDPARTPEPTNTRPPAPRPTTASPTTARATPAPPTATPTPSPTPSPTITPSPTLDIDPPAILLYDITPLIRRAGETVTIQWRAVGDAVAIKTVYIDGRAGRTYDGLASEGRLDVIVDAGERNDITYVLEVRAGAETVTSRITVDVICPLDWFFDNAPSMCPREVATISRAAGQYFENGFMIWTAARNDIGVFYEDAAGGHVFYLDEWREGMPVSDPALTPPTGLYQPVRGFGLVWRERPGGAGFATVRERLGWGIVPEFEFETAYQCAEGVERGEVDTSVEDCYQRGPDGRIIVLQTNTWSIYGEP